MADPLRWGIMGTGNIARQFVAGIRGAPRSKAGAVGSRRLDSAQHFAKQNQISATHDSYEALLADDAVDAIYLSLPNSMHHEWTIKALHAGKHVLCEKPLASNSAQAKEMFDVAEKAGRLLVEAFMYRSHPQTAAILETIRSGAIGQVKLVRTSFCFRIAKTEGNIRFDAAMAGGSLMDVGCYCLNFSRLIAGVEPDKMFAAGVLHASGVDESASVSLHFPGDILASFSCGMQTQADNSAYICGTEGYLEIPWPWKPQRTARFAIAHSTPPRQDAGPGQTITRPPREERTVEAPLELYGLEADDFAAAALDGSPPRISRSDTLGNMACLDELRRQIGVKV